VGIVDPTREALRRYGAAGALRRFGLRGAIRRAWSLAWGGAVVREEHVWYAIDLRNRRPEERLPDGLTLHRGEEADLALLDELDTIPLEERLARIRSGHSLWLVLEGSKALFSCWIFRDSTPAIAAPGGWLSLPAGTVCQEDSVTAPAARGRGIAPRAWAAIADELAAEGELQLIRKVGAENAPSHRAGEKAGFEPIARMSFTKLGPTSRTSVEVLDQGRGGVLADRLDSRRVSRSAS